MTPAAAAAVDVDNDNDLDRLIESTFIVSCEARLARRKLWERKKRVAARFSSTGGVPLPHHLRLHCKSFTTSQKQLDDNRCFFRKNTGNYNLAQLLQPRPPLSSSFDPTRERERAKIIGLEDYTKK